MRYAVKGVFFALLAVQLSAQASTPSPREGSGFEVVSVKPAPPGRLPPAVAAALAGGCTFNGARMACAAITVEQLIKRAIPAPDGSALRSSQIVGGPEWLVTSQFEVIGTMPAAVEREEMARLIPAALRQVLETRFKFRSHFERRPMPVYALVKANKDGRLGLQMREAPTDCPPLPNGAPARPSTVTVADRTCYGGSFQVGSIQSGAITMAGLASSISAQNPTDPRPVLDRTELSGKFEVNLRWTPLITTAGSPDVGQSDLPDLFTAIREQLGLRLEPTTEITDVVVVDGVESPEPN